MGLVEKVQEWIDLYTPRMEAVFGVTIGKIEARPYSIKYKEEAEHFIEGCKKENYPIGSFTEKLLYAVSFCLNKLTEDLFCMGVINGINRVYVNNSVISHLLSSNRHKQTAVVHELAHQFVNKVHNQAKKEALEVNIGSYYSKMLNEGFAEFVRLELTEIYEPDTKLKKFINKKRRWQSRNEAIHFLFDLPSLFMQVPYRRGYKFWKYISEGIGKGNLLKIWDQPPTINEIRQPELYVKRLNSNMEKN